MLPAGTTMSSTSQRRVARRRTIAAQVLISLLLSLVCFAAEPAAARWGERARLDHAEEMRALVRRIAADARSRDPDFIVVAAGGPDLLMDPAAAVDAAPDAPVIRYLSAVDGVLLSPPPPDPDAAPGAGRDPVDDVGRMVRDQGRAVWVMDAAADRNTGRKAWQQRRQHGFVSFAAAAPGPTLTALPPYGGRPFGENARSVTTLAEAANFAYVGSPLAYGSEAAFLQALADTNYDAVVIDAFHGRRPVGKETVRALQFKKLGARRLVLAHLDIGAAGADRYYWKDQWVPGTPPWLEAPTGTAGQHFVRYWQPGWQRLITGAQGSYVDGLISLGFDGVVLEGLDTWRYFARGEVP